MPTRKRGEFDYDSGKTPLQVFRIQHDLWLIEESAFSFDYIYTLLNYDIDAAKFGHENDYIIFSDDNPFLIYDEDLLEIERWIECVLKLVEEFEQLTRLLLHIFELSIIDFYRTIDNHNMPDIGKYFGTE